MHHKAASLIMFLCYGSVLQAEGMVDTPVIFRPQHIIFVLAVFMQVCLHSMDALLQRWLVRQSLRQSSLLMVPLMTMPWPHS